MREWLSGMFRTCFWWELLQCNSQEQIPPHVQVGFGKDFQASRNIHNDVGQIFRLLGSFLVEAVKRNGSPLRQYSRSPV